MPNPLTVPAGRGLSPHSLTPVSHPLPVLSAPMADRGKGESARQGTCYRTKTPAHKTREATIPAA